MKKIISVFMSAVILMSLCCVWPVQAAGAALQEDFELYDAGTTISTVPNWILRNNTGVTGVIKEESGNKYLEFARSANANGALRWDFSDQVAASDVYTVSYRLQIPQDSYESANTNISISETEAGSTGPCISVAGNGIIKYFTGEGNTQATAVSGLSADEWIDISMVVYKTERRAMLYINNSLISEMLPRSTSENLTMLSIFMSNKVQSLYFDDFVVEDGVNIKIECNLSENFEEAEAGVSVGSLPYWKLRSNTAVTGIIETDGNNNYLTLTKGSSANAALLWDFSSLVAQEDVFTVSYKVMIPSESYLNAGVNISVSDNYAISTGPCINISSGGTVMYFTGDENTMLLAKDGIGADEWINIRMVVYKSERRARLYVDNAYIDDIYPRDGAVDLNKISIFLSNYSQSIMFDDFTLVSGADIIENIDELIAAGTYKFTDTTGNEVNAVPYGGDLNASMTVNNPLDESKDIVLVLALYDSTGALKTVNIEKGVVKAEAVTSFEVTVSSEDMTGCSAKLFVWDNNMRPVINAKTLGSRELLWLPSVFGDNAVIQRDEAFKVWGEAVPGSTVTVEIGNNSYNTLAGDDGKWELTAEAISALDNPYTMAVSSDAGASLTFNNILAGDVWLCSGQSNMELSLVRADGASEEIASADYPEIRLFSQTKNGTENISGDVINGGWNECSPETVQSFSAVGYLFGKELHKDLDVPVGLIFAAYGGARMESFVSREALLDSPLAERADYISPTDLKRSASRIFNAMIAPIIPYTLKGCIWYQGCANVELYDEYYELSKIMLNDWRQRWGDLDMPFIITQLAAYGREDVENISYYPYLREAQLKFAQDESLDNVGMAVILESGEKDNIHPTDKYTPAHRLALVAKGMVYGMDVEYMYPSPVYYEVQGDVISVYFENVYSGLQCSGEVLNGFEIMDSDGNWYSAKAQIDGANKINVSDCEHIPVAVRFGFAPYPDPMVNLYNSAGLLSTPFRIGEYQ